MANKTNTVRTDLERALSACRGAFGAMALFSLFINLLLFVVPLYMLQIFDRVLSSRSVTTLVMLTVIAGAMLVVLGLLELVRSRLLVRIGVKLDTLLKNRVFTAVFRGSLKAPGGGHGQALRDLDTLREFLTGSGVIAFCDAPWVPIFIAVGFLFHPVLGFISLGGAIVIFCLALANELVTRKLLREASQLSVSTNAFVDASLRNAEVLHAMGMMPGMLRRWGTRHGRVLGLQARASDRAGVIVSASKVVRLGLQVGILGAGAYLVLLQEISPGTMIAASIVMARSLAPVEMAVGQWRGFVSARTAYDRLKALLAAVPAEGERMLLPKPRGEITVERVIAVPPGSRIPALKGVSFELSPGEVLGIIGPSAAGKSTLARVLVGVWPVAAGSVRLDGAELSHWSADDLGPHIGYLPQDVELFDGTVAENISRFTELDTDLVIDAARKAGAHDMIQLLPDGYDTQIGAGGRSLSGGQCQRIALARALYGDPSIIVLDEPNASLDSEGEAALVAALMQLKGEGRTVIVITHRLNLLSAADKILVLKAGTAEAMGGRDEVLARYARPAVVDAAAAGGDQSRVTPLKRS